MLEYEYTIYLCITCFIEYVQVLFPPPSPLPPPLGKPQINKYFNAILYQSTKSTNYTALYLGDRFRNEYLLEQVS